jgi:Protein of unknown function (DUF3500)
VRASRGIVDNGAATAPREIAAVQETQGPVEALYRSLSPPQRREISFPWDHVDPERGLLRAFIANHWQVTRPCVRGEFFTRAQQHLIHDIFASLVDPAWYPRFLKQLRDDCKGHEWGADQSIALFGDPDRGALQFVITGRHLTLRSEAHGDGRAAFGGPILYGHQATGFYERANHPGNIFWEQALLASSLAAMLDEAQLAAAVVDVLPEETQIAFREDRVGLPVASLTVPQRVQLERTLAALLEPFRAADRAHAMQCLSRQGGLDRCHLAFARDGRMSAPHWDNWRLEGPGLVWHFRGFPHVHVWVHVAADPGVAVNARRGTFIFPEHDPLR